MTPVSDVTKIEFEHDIDLSFVDKHRVPQTPKKPPCDQAIERFHYKLKNMRSLDWATLNFELGLLFDTFNMGGTEGESQ